MENKEEIENKFKDEIKEFSKNMSEYHIRVRLAKAALKTLLNNNLDEASIQRAISEANSAYSMISYYKGKIEELRKENAKIKLGLGGENASN